MWLNLENIFYLIAFFCMAGTPFMGPKAFAADSSASDDKTQNSATQQVGGLLFDVDEGVKVEQGPGGSVYVKSNRETMQEKFKEIEHRLSTLEERVNQLESGASGKSKKSSSGSPEDAGRHVYVT